MPSGIQSGDLLLIFWADRDVNSTLSTPSGWTPLYNTDNSNYRAACYYRIANGTEGSTVTMTTSSNERSTHNTYRIQVGTYTGVPIASSAATGTSTTPNPPSLNTGSSDNYLWIAASHSEGAATANSAPTNFTNLISAVNTTGTSNSNRYSIMATARRNLATQTLDPGTFTLSQSRIWSSYTIAIKGAVPCVTPTAYSVTGGGSYCSGGAGVAVGLSNSEVGVTYQLYNGASMVGSPVTGTGSAISFGNQTTAGTYTIVATRTSGGCTNNMAGSVVVVVSTQPTATGVTICQGGTGFLTSSFTCPDGSSVPVGPNFPGAVGNGGSGTVWSPSSGTLVNAINADGGATAISSYSGSGNASSQNLLATNFGFAIPSGASIKGISVDINRYRDGTPGSAGFFGSAGTVGDIQDNNVQLIVGGSATGTNKAIGGNWSTTTSTIASYGSTIDTWGTSLTWLKSTILTLELY